MRRCELRATELNVNVYDDRAAVCCGHRLIYLHRNVYYTECLLLGIHCDLLFLRDLCLN